MLRFSATALAALLAPRGVQALFETTYHSSPLAIQPFTILQKSADYDPDNTTLFLTCPAGSAVAQPGPTIYKSNGELVWSDPSFANCGDLNIQTFDGEQYLTLWYGSGSPLVGTGNGVGVMLNSRYEVVRNVTAVNPLNTDVHEFNIVKAENKTALVTAYNPIPADLSSVGGPADGWYLNAIIQEIDIASGKVLFNWTSIDHIGLNESYSSPTLVSQGNSSGTAWDAVHINSIDKDNAGDYLISSRHCQTIYKIDGKTGSIVWRLGGKNSDFTSLSDDTDFHWQHHARWRAAESMISLFDDEAGALGATAVFVDGKTASGKYLNVDQTKMTVSLAKMFTPGPIQNVSFAEGSTEPYGSTVLVGYGSNPWIQAYDSASQSLLFSGIIGPNNASLWLGGVSNYRAFQTSTLEFVGRPTQPPSVVVSNITQGVFVSWNGATHVAEYALYTGDEPGSVTRLVRSQRKDGFETKLDAQGVGAYVRVDALAQNGTTLGRSEVYRTSDGSVVGA